ncbi:MAG: KaiC domain-containing protein [Candidatus Methanoperedenaceae archaeon]|nr:KaiC domain-containing protein [Candidatus Methanoperedenaceae archaeon]
MENVKIGIPGLDELLIGGIPKGHIVSVLGSPGTGKSTLALQFTYEGLKSGDNCIYLSLEESEEDITKTAEMFGWHIQPYIDNGTLNLIRLSALNIKSTIDRVENDLPRLFKNSQRLTIDPITLYEMIYESEAERRESIFNFAKNIKETGITTLLVSEANNENQFESKYGNIDYISDGIILLRRIRQQNLRLVTMVIEVSKMRRVDHSKEIRPYNITRNGMVVHSAEVF